MKFIKTVLLSLLVLPSVSFSGTGIVPIYDNIVACKYVQINPVPYNKWGDQKITRVLAVRKTGPFLPSENDSFRGKITVFRLVVSPNSKSMGGHHLKDEVIGSSYKTDGNEGHLDLQVPGDTIFTARHTTQGFLLHRDSSGVIKGQFAHFSRNFKEFANYEMDCTDSDQTAISWFENLKADAKKYGIGIWL